MKKKKTTQHIKKNKSEEMIFKQKCRGEWVEDKADPVNPPHYNETLIAPIDVIEDWDLGFCLGNCIKYIARAGKKADNDYKDELRKAAWYLERAIGKKR